MNAHNMLENFYEVDLTPNTGFCCILFEFSLNDLPNPRPVWLPDSLHLTVVTFLDVGEKKNFPLLPVDWYLFRLAIGNRY